MITATAQDTDEQLLARAVADLARRTRFPVAFGGLQRDGSIHVSAVVGARTHHIDGLVVRSRRGLGGRALVEKRPRVALDYKAARSITHDYDRAILGEGIATLFAIPVVVSGSTRGVLYCGSWAESPVGDVVARPAFGVADELATEFLVRDRVRDEVEQRMSQLPVSQSVPLAASTREELRDTYAELRSITASVADDALRARLTRLERRIAGLSHEDGHVADPGDVHLTAREVDVLAYAAVGATNAQIAASLEVKEATVKSYLAAAMGKLDASTRHAAVARARRAGILP